jgi:hypothetical protein
MSDTTTLPFVVATCRHCGAGVSEKVQHWHGVHSFCGTDCIISYLDKRIMKLENAMRAMMET